MGAAEHVQSLTTVCAPHHGMRLVDNYNRYPERYRIDMVEKAFEVLGMSVRNVNEFTAKNLAAFN